MGKALLVAAGLAALVSGQADAHHQMLMLQLRGVTQAQFAGYYVAEYQGFYDEMAIGVIINPGGPGIDPAQVLADGGANIIIDWMPAALASREQGVPLVNIAQPFKRSGLCSSAARTLASRRRPILVTGQLASGPAVTAIRSPPGWRGSA